MAGFFAFSQDLPDGPVDVPGVPAPRGSAEVVHRVLGLVRRARRRPVRDGRVATVGVSGGQFDEGEQFAEGRCQSGGRHTVVFDEDAFEDGLVELAFDVVGDLRVEPVAVGDQLQGVVESVLDGAEFDVQPGEGPVGERRRELMGAWVHWAQTCDCRPNDGPRCPRHRWEAAADQFIRLIDEDWYRVADWYKAR